MAVEPFRKKFGKPELHLSLNDPQRAASSPALRMRLGAGTTRRHRALRVLLVADSLAVALALMAGGLTTSLEGGRSSDAVRELAYMPIVLATLAVYGLYRRGQRRLLASTFPDLGPLLHSLMVSCLILILVEGYAHRILGLPYLHYWGAALIGVVAFTVIPLSRAAFRWLTFGPRARKSRVLIIGSGLVASSVLQRARNSSDLEVVGYVDERPLATKPLLTPQVPLLGGLDVIPNLLDELDIDHLLVAFTPVNESDLAALLRSLADRVRISIVPRMFDLLTVRSHVDDLCGLPVVDVAPPSLGFGARFAKRTLDIVVSGAALAILGPLMLLIALAIRTTSRGPAIFRQERTGRDGLPFYILKFRTMYENAEAHRITLATQNEVDGPIFKIHNDPRVTRIGRFLRRTSLDELPQLINVLRGDMSLVGPRPFVTAEAAEIGGWAARRFSVRPGMTGLWQISGRNDLPFEDLRRLDYCYVASWSLWWDLQILWHTPGTILRRQGAY